MRSFDVPETNATVTTPRDPATLATAEAKTGFRFFLVSVCAFLADFVLALSLREVFGLSITVAAAIGFVTAWFGSYLGHEYYTFRGADSRASVGRLTRNLISNGAALATRLAVIFVIESIHAPETTVIAGLYLLTGAGCSFTVNFLLNRFWVFSRK